MAACGTGQRVTVTVTTPQSSTTSTTSAAATPTTTGEDNSASTTRVIGTVTQTGSGTKVVETVSLGSLGYGQAGAPPQDVLDSYTNQNEQLSSVIDSSAYAYGVLSFKYVGGRVPIDVSFTNQTVLGNVTGGFPPDADAIYQIDGQWTDGGADGEPPGFSMNPDSTVDVPVWLGIGEAVTNREATIPQDKLDLMTWRIVPTVDQMGLDPQTSYSGPLAADCGTDNKQLLPFATLPFTHVGDPESSVRDDSVTCRARDASSTTTATTASAAKSCVFVKGSLTSELLVSLRCPAARPGDEAKCGFDIRPLLSPAPNASKTIAAAKSLDALASLPVSAHPVAMFLFDLYHSAEFPKGALPQGYQTATQIRDKLNKVKTAWDLMQMLPELAQVYGGPGAVGLGRDLQNVAGLKGCIGGMQQGLESS